MTAIYVEDKTLNYKELVSLIDQTEIVNPIFPVTQTLDCVIFILTCLIKGIPFFPYSPHLTKKPDVTFPKGCDFILHTSGSTKMKYAFFSKEALIQSNIHTHPSFRLKAGDVYLLNLPLFHIAGLSLLMRAFLRGAAVGINPVNPSIITHISIVPAMAAPLLKEQLYPNIKAVLLGGNVIHKTLADALIDKGYPLYVTYGMTEMSSHVFVSKYNSEDGVCFHTPLKGRDIKFDKRGVLLVKGCGKFIRYKDHTEEEWICTKDRFEVKNGKYHFLRRVDTMFISGGENIYPEEIKRALLTHPGITKVEVKTIPHFKWGKRPCVAITLSDEGVTNEGIRLFLKDLLEPFKIPKKQEITLYTQASFEA